MFKSIKNKLFGKSDQNSQSVPASQSAPEKIYEIQPSEYWESYSYMWAIMSNTTNYVLDNAAVQRVGQIDGVTLHEVKPISEEGVAEFVVTYQGENYRFLAALDPVDLTHVFENQRCDFTDDELAQLQGTNKHLSVVTQFTNTPRELFHLQVKIVVAFKIGVPTVDENGHVDTEQL